MFASAAQHYSVFMQCHLLGRRLFENTRKPQMKKNVVASAEVSVKFSSMMLVGYHFWVVMGFVPKNQFCFGYPHCIFMNFKN